MALAIESLDFGRVAERAILVRIESHVGLQIFAGLSPVVGVLVLTVTRTVKIYFKVMLITQAFADQRDLN